MKPAVASKHTNEHGTAAYSGATAITNLIASYGTATITRPANVLAYIAGDMIGQADGAVAANPGDAILKFADMGSPGGIVKILAADLMVNLAAVPVGMGAFTLHLYDAAPDAKLDNVPFAFASVNDRARYLGAIAIGAPAVLGATLFAENNALAKQVKLAAGSTDLYGVLVSAGAYTPTSGEVYKLRLQADCRS